MEHYTGLKRFLPEDIANNDPDAMYQLSIAFSGGTLVNSNGQHLQLKPDDKMTLKYLLKAAVHGHKNAIKGIYSYFKILDNAVNNSCKKCNCCINSMIYLQPLLELLIYGSPKYIQVIEDVANNRGSKSARKVVKDYHTVLSID